jgi:ABC-type transport system involved in multi-copper enzyme maturation permease subunit
MIKPVFAIALNTFRETVRDRVLYAFFVFACSITVLGILLGSLSVGQDIRIIEDIGLTVIAIIGGIISVFAGTNLVYKELERRTIYVIFTKPVSSWQFIAGKYLGLVSCIFVVVLAMGLFLLALIWMVDPSHQTQRVPLMAASLGLVFLELLFVLALATFFSTFSNPIMSVIFTLSLWFIGHLGGSLLDLSRMSTNSAIQQLLSSLYWCLPDLAQLTRIRSVLMYGKEPTQEIIIYMLAYVFAFVFFLLGLASIVNDRREFP